MSTCITDQFLYAAQYRYASWDDDEDDYVLTVIRNFDLKLHVLRGGGWPHGCNI